MRVNEWERIRGKRKCDEKAIGMKENRIEWVLEERVSDMRESGMRKNLKRKWEEREWDERATGMREWKSVEREKVG